MSERQEQGLSLLTDAMNMDEGQQMTRKMIDPVLELQETVSLPPGSPCTTLTLPHCLSLSTLQSFNEQLEKGRSWTAATDKERTTHEYLECFSSSISICELLTFEQFKLKYGRSLGKPASLSAIPTPETCQAGTNTRETREMDSIKSIFSSDSK